MATSTSTKPCEGNAPRVQPLRVDTVLRASRGVKDWTKLAESLIGCTNPKLAAIQTQHGSVEDRLRAVVEHWLQDGGHPSWRVIIWALDRAEESELADSIRDYAEPPRDPTLTVDNVAVIFEEVSDWGRLKTQLEVPEYLVDRQRHLTEREQKRVIGEWYVRTSPLASWEDLMKRLYSVEEDDAVEEAKEHLANDPFLTTKNVMDVLRDVEKCWDSMGRQLGVRRSKRDRIRNLHQNNHKKMEAVVNHYVTRYPIPSWKRLATTIRGMGFANLAELVTDRYITGDPTFTPDNVMEVMEGQEGRWDTLGDLLGVDKGERERIGYLYQSDLHQRMWAILDHYVRHNRSASWKQLATALKRMGLDNLASVVTTKHVREPSITAHPKNQRSLTGDTVTFRVETTGKPPLHFSWLHGETVVKEAQSSVLILMDVRKNDEGEYRCLLENQFGKILSKPAELKVDDPGIAAHPTSQKCLPGESVTFCVEARGETQLTFRWLHGDCVLKGADGPLLTLTDVSDHERGIYMCVVENESGKVSSEEVELEIGDPLILTPPENQTSLPGEVVTFSVETKGTAPLHFRWLHDGNVIKRETDVLTLTAVRKADSGKYQCQVENQFGMKASKPAELCVADVVYSDLNILRDDRLGSGAFGTVWKAVWVPGRKVVAVKEGSQLNPREVEILQSLNHPNIIVFHGCVSSPHGMMLIVTEFAENGSIFDYVHKEKKMPSLQQGLYWAEQVAEAMKYLHQQKYIHRDLKSSNVLLSSDLTAKICDLGSARNLQHTTKQTTVVGTYAWMSPEMLLRGQVSTACDVYSYGILLWEIITHETPFADMAPLVAAFAAADDEQRLRPPLPDCEDYMKCLIEQCWQHAPEDRPTFEEVLTVLKTKVYNATVSAS